MFRTLGGKGGGVAGGGNGKLTSARTCVHTSYCTANAQNFLADDVSPFSAAAAVAGGDVWRGVLWGGGVLPGKEEGFKATCHKVLHHVYRKLSRLELPKKLSRSNPMHFTPLTYISLSTFHSRFGIPVRVFPGAHLFRLRRPRPVSVLFRR